MKKALLYTLCGLMVTPSLKAQADGNELRLGITFSPNFSWLSPDSKGLESDGTKTGYSFGLLAEFPFGSKGAYAFRTGLGVSSIGGKIKADFVNTDNATVSSSHDMSRKYLQLPLLLRLGTKADKPLNFYGIIGGSLGMNIRSRDSYSSSSTLNGVTTTVSDDDVDILDQVSLLQIAIVVGAGMELNLNDGPSLFGGINYNKGLTNVPDKDAKFLLNPDKKSKMLADFLEISLGVFF